MNGATRTRNAPKPPPSQAYTHITVNTASAVDTARRIYPHAAATATPLYTSFRCRKHRSPLSLSKILSHCFSLPLATNTATTDTTLHPPGRHHSFTKHHSARRLSPLSPLAISLYSCTTPWVYACMYLYTIYIILNIALPVTPPPLRAVVKWAAAVQSDTERGEVEHGEVQGVIDCNVGGCRVQDI